MYVNKCVKCGREFETKNPKRVICPDCLYPDKKMMINPSDSGSENTSGASGAVPQQEQLNGYSTETQPQFYNSYSAGEGRPRPQRSYNNAQGGYQRRDNQKRDNRGGYNRPQGNYQRRDNRGYNKSQGGFQRRDNRGGFGKPNFNRGGFNNKRPMGKNKTPKQLLIGKDQLEQIENLYKLMLPLPNPDAHEVIAEKIGLEPRKVFFGINLIRQKLMLPKLPFPKRKLAITPDQLFAIKNLYEPLLPLPPIGCHKIIAAQLKMDEWRVHVGIGLIRSQMGLQRWNQEREDVPEEFKNQQTKDSAKSEETPAAEELKQEAAVAADALQTPETPVEEEKPKRGRKPKKAEEAVEE